MSAGAPTVWLRVTGEATAALVLLLLADPDPLRRKIPQGLGLALGGAAGVLLVVVLARRLPPARIRWARLPVVAGKAGLLALAAFCEEVVWRWFAIGTLASSIGLAAAFVASTVGFALVHAGQGARAIPVHLVTGSAFGAVFLATGSLAAAIVAHATYNLSILAALESRRAARPASAQGPA